MGKSATSKRPAKRPAAVDLDADLAGIAAISIDELRARWRESRGQEPPAALSKDLLARALAHWLQEDALGGLDPRVLKLLSAAAIGVSLPPRRVKVGSVVVREYQGKLYEVMVLPDGFCWQGQVYASLSTIAQKITGTSWNGPRFFGLRSVEQVAASEVPAQATTQNRPLLRRGSIKARPSAKNDRGPT